MMMTWKKLLDAIRKALGGKPAPAPKPAPVPIPAPVPPPAPSDVPAEMLAEHNARRTEAGLPPFVPSVKLQAAAQGHDMLMAQLRRMEHQLAGEGDLGSRLRGVGYAFRFGGENIAWNYRSVAELMRGWMASDGHRANILSPSFTEVGFAVSYANDGSPYYCSVFGTPAIVMAGVYASGAPYTVGTPEVTSDGMVAASSIQVLID